VSATTSTAGSTRRAIGIAVKARPTKRMLLQVADHSGLSEDRRGLPPARDTAAAIQRAGFQLETSDRIMFAASRLEPSIPCILDVVRRA
jgi:hypothetical protein